MILTFELDKSGGSIDIHFDSEGKEMLLETLRRLDKPGEHEHMMRLPGVNAASPNLLSNHQFDRESRPLDEVTLVFLGADEKAITNQFGESE